MGKVTKRNIRAKAKSAIARFKETNLKIGLESKSATADEESEDKLPLHQIAGISKKQKHRQNHKKLIQKLTLIKKQRKDEIANQNREKAAIVKNLKPLKDALPSLDELVKISRDNKQLKTGIKEYDEVPQPLSKKQKIKQKRDKFISQVKSYEALLNDPDFKKSPREVISYHIKYNHGLINKE